MSRTSYREAAGRLRVALDILDPYEGGCECGHPDQRHWVADGIAARVAAGEDPETVADDYLREDGDAADSDVAVVLELTVAVLAADRRMHHLTAVAAAVVDAEVWADAEARP